LVLGCWWLVVGGWLLLLCKWSETSRSTFTTFKRRVAATDVGILPHVFPSSRLLLLSSPTHKFVHNIRNKAFATSSPAVQQSSTEEASLPTGVAWNVCFCIAELIARAMWTNPSIGSTVVCRKDVSQTRATQAVHRGFHPVFHFPSLPTHPHTV